MPQKVTAIDEGALEKVWERCARVEQQVRLLQNLLKEGVGTRDIESFLENQTKAKKSKGNKVRDEATFKSSMNSKLVDAEQTAIEARKEKAKERRKLERKLGENSTTYKKLIKRLKEKAGIEKNKKSEKHADKIKHLRGEYKPEDLKTPKGLEKYRELLIFSGKDVPISRLEPPEVLDDLEMDEDEMAALALQPKYSVERKLVEERHEVEAEKCLAKHRWDVRSRESERDQGKDSSKDEEEENEEEEVWQAAARQVFDPVEKEFDMRRMKATDCKHNTRVILPKALEPRSEAMMEVRMSEWMKIFSKYKTEKCDEEGQQESNLTAAQKKGMTKLRKRTKDGELIICETDKSGKLVVMSQETYLKAGYVHTAGDKEINLDGVRQLEKKCNGHSSMLMKIFNIGSDWGHHDRHRETKINHSLEVPKLKLLYKDHKNWNPDSGTPPLMRPVALANKGINVHLSDIVSTVLEPVGSAMRDTFEVDSTDDLLSINDKINNQVDKQTGPSTWAEGGKKNPPLPHELSAVKGKVVECAGQMVENSDIQTKVLSGIKQQLDQPIIIIGADAVALYPSILKGPSSVTVKKAMLETEVKFSGINYKEGTRYIALELTEAEIAMSGLRRVLPVRRGTRGTKPAIYGPLAMSAGIDDDSQWRFPRVELTELEKKRILATVMQIAVRAVFDTHVYQFAGKLYHQQRGGPIGLRATCAIAKVVMGDWDRRLHNVMTNNGLSIEEGARYVDDVRLWLHAIEMGWRWTEHKKLEFKEEWRAEELEQNITATQKTAAVLIDIMNSVSGMLTFTSETAEDFVSGTLPTLDTQLWMEGRKVKYMFFEKPMANSRVLNRKTAMSENGMVASLSQEVVRRCKNTSEELTQEQKNQVLDRYTEKLLTSGHSRKQAHRIMTAGLTGYERLLQKQKNGIANIHRPSSSGLAARNRKKLLSKTKWFKTKHQGAKNINKERGPQLAGGNPNKVKSSISKENTAEEIPTTSILFVDHTPGGELAKRFREAEQQLSQLTGFRVKIAERNGIAVKQLLQNDPWALARCERPDCYPCETGDKQSCFTRNILYSHQCTACKKVYIGESSRSANERGGEHQDDFEKQKEDSHQFKHTENDHQGPDPPKFEFRVIGTFQSAMTRQIAEAVRIRREGEAILNSKGVFNRCKLPRLVVEGREKEEEWKEKKEDQHEHLVENWRKKESRKRTAQNFTRGAKKVKMDRDNDSPRHHGLVKRKMPETLEQFESQCKKLRPSFDPEEECIGLECGNSRSVSNYKPIIFFSIFSKSNKKLNHEIMFKKPTKKGPIFSSTPNSTKPKPKIKTKKPKAKKASNLTEIPGQKGIRGYLESLGVKESERRGMPVGINSTVTYDLLSTTAVSSIKSVEKEVVRL